MPVDATAGASGEVETTIALKGLGLLLLLVLAWGLQSMVRHRGGPHYESAWQRRVFTFATPAGYELRPRSEDPRRVRLFASRSPTATGDSTRDSPRAPSGASASASIAVGDMLYRYPWERADLRDAERCRVEGTRYAAAVGGTMTRSELAPTGAGPACQFEIDTASEIRVVTLMQSDVGDRAVLCRQRARPRSAAAQRAGCAAFLASWRWQEET